jgi:hypothetical protein
MPASVSKLPTLTQKTSAVASTPSGSRRASSSHQEELPPLSTTKAASTATSVTASTPRVPVTELRAKFHTLKQQLLQARSERTNLEDQVAQVEQRRHGLLYNLHKAEYPDEDLGVLMEQPHIATTTTTTSTTAPTTTYGGGMLNFIMHDTPFPVENGRKKSHRVVRDYCNRLIDDRRKLFGLPEVTEEELKDLAEENKRRIQSKVCICEAHKFRHPNPNGSSGTVATQFHMAGSPSKHSFHSLFHKKARRTRMYSDYEGRQYLVDLTDPPDLAVLLP